MNERMDGEPRDQDLLGPQADLQAELKLRERQLHAIHRVTEALFSHSLVDDMLRETLAVAIEVLQADAGSIQLHDVPSDTLVFRHVTYPQAHHLIGYGYPASRGISGHVFATAKAELTHRARENPNFNREVDQITGYHTESMLTVPLKRLGGQPLGVMQILNSRHRFEERDLKVLEVLSAQAAASIETARLTQKAKKAEIVNLLGDISHDIKNMLTPIQCGLMTLSPMLDGMFEAFDKAGASTPQRVSWPEAIQEMSSTARDNYGWILESALDSADKLHARTREIADAVKGEVTPPFFEEANINDTVHSVALALRPMAEASGVQLHLDLDSQMPFAHFDLRQIYIALYNLTNNAIPETPAGGSVTIRTRAPQPGEDTLLLEVEDTGRGIPDHIKSRLFTDQTISTKAGGTGLAPASWPV